MLKYSQVSDVISVSICRQQQAKPQCLRMLARTGHGQNCNSAMNSAHSSAAYVASPELLFIVIRKKCVRNSSQRCTSGDFENIFDNRNENKAKFMNLNTHQPIKYIKISFTFILQKLTGKMGSYQNVCVELFLSG